MKSKVSFKNDIINLLHAFVEFGDSTAGNPQVRIDPQTLYVALANGADFIDEIADTEENIENEAAAESNSAEEAADFQAQRDPDFYPVSRFLTLQHGKRIINQEAVDRLVDSYYN